MTEPQDFRNCRNNADERLAAWKILLPLDPTSRVIALGVDRAVLDSLRRSYANISGSLDHPVGAIVVIGLSAEVSDLQWPLLASADYLVFDDTAACFDRDLAAAGFELKTELCGIPRHMPRLYIDMHDRHSIVNGLSFHSPGGWKKRLLLDLCRISARGGLRFHLRGRRVKIYSKKDMRSSELFQAVNRNLGSPVESASIYTGSISHKRKYTVIARLVNGNSAVLKVADSPAGVQAVEQETEILRQLVETPLGGSVPTVLFAESPVEAYFLQAQSLLPSSGSKPFFAHKIPNPVILLLQQLAMVGRRDSRLADSGLWPLLRQGDFSGRVAAGALWCWLETNASVSVPCSLCHGDFAPWNFRCHDRKLLIYDWEDAAENMPIGIDLFHFMFRQASLLGPWLKPMQFVNAFGENLRQIVAATPEYAFLVMASAILREYVLIENHDYRYIDELAGCLVNHVEAS